MDKDVRTKGRDATEALLAKIDETLRLWGVGSKEPAPRG